MHVCVCKFANSLIVSLKSNKEIQIILPSSYSQLLAHLFRVLLHSWSAIDVGEFFLSHQLTY